ncbi:WD repeat domain phosphoinositide-interacting protein 2 [Pelomyxa schiedti]|nr:WD repeat domain phosphoinositide-interacting protein 2 [Pelomyxa schiedti]
MKCWGVSGVNAIDFNQDCSCVAVGSTVGFTLFNVTPHETLHSRTVGGSVSVCQMLYTTPLVVVAVKLQDEPSEKLFVYNINNQHPLCDFNFGVPICNVRLNNKRLVIILEAKIHVYDLGTMKFLHSIDTEPNPRGICALSSAPDTGGFIGYPGRNPGEIAVFDVDQIRPVAVAKAHNGPLVVIAFNSAGTLVATASSKGTIIRIFSIPDMRQIVSFRRGSNPATIYSIAFSLNSTILAVSSDTSTVHLFKIPDPSTVPIAETTTPKGWGSYLSSYVPYLSTVCEMWKNQRSYANARLPVTAIATLCGINSDNTLLYVACANGNLYIYTLADTASMQNPNQTYPLHTS